MGYKSELRRGVRMMMIMMMSGCWLSPRCQPTPYADDSEESWSDIMDFLNGKLSP